MRDLRRRGGRKQDDLRFGAGGGGGCGTQSRGSGRGRVRRRAGAQSRGPRGHRATEAEERREPGLQGEEHLGTLNLTEECLFLADFKTNVSNKKKLHLRFKNFFTIHLLPNHKISQTESFSGFWIY